MNRVWAPRPLHLVVVEILGKKGALTDIDLQKELEDAYGEVSYRELNRVLLKLEVNGIVRVSRLMKGKRRVELVPGAAS